MVLEIKEVVKLPMNMVTLVLDHYPAGWQQRGLQASEGISTRRLVRTEQQ